MVVVVVVLLGAVEEDGVDIGDDETVGEEDIVLASCILRCQDLLRTKT